AGRLVSIPVQRKKRLAILKWLVEDFQPGRLYPETEVNRVISRRHPDFAALRRYLVDEELMQRRRGVYWRTGTMPNVGFDPPSWPCGACPPPRWSTWRSSWLRSRVSCSPST